MTVASTTKSRVESWEWFVGSNPPLDRCSCCQRTADDYAMVHISACNLIAFCRRCVRAMNRPRAIGQESRSAPLGGSSGKPAIVKVFTFGVERCVVCARDRGVRIAIWRGQRCEIVCEPCVDGMAAALRRSK